MKNQDIVKSAVAVLVPSVVVHHLDPHTGIPFMPHMAGYLAGALDAQGYRVQAIDCFGLQPNHRRKMGEFMLLGVDEQWVVQHLDAEVQVVFLYCRTLEDFISIERLIVEIKKSKPQLKICVFENIQTVNSFSIKLLVDDLFKIGCDAAIMGEPERRAGQVVVSLIKGDSLEDIPGVAYTKDNQVLLTSEEALEKDLDDLPFPLWEKFPLDGYWIAGFAHAPVGRYRFLPILTSRGCPYACTFCISPELNNQWRPRSAKNVVDEMEYFYRNLKVTDFHVSDLNPTVSEERIRELSALIIKRELPITWKLAQGTKIETIQKEDTVSLMAQAGCVYISFSPETGSPRLLKTLNKSFDYAHGLKMASQMNRLHIRSQTCFLAGVPGETEEDRRLSLSYVDQLIKAGVDEIAVYILTPLPGAKLYHDENLKGFEHYSQCTRSPTWRKDYREIQKFRMKLYLTFFSKKLYYHPLKVLREVFSFFSGRFETKMEMSFYKIIKFYVLYYLPWVFKGLNPEEKMQILEKAVLKKSQEKQNVGDLV